jgi:hypothetical protein
VRSLAWIAATTIGFVAGGLALHSPGATELGQYPFAWDVSAAIVGAVFGAVVGAFTGFLQARTIGGPAARLIVAAIVGVAIAHALADGAPATWGVSLAAAISGVAAALAFGWAARSLDPRALALMSFAWWAGWVGSLALLGAIATAVGYGVVNDHLVIGAVLGLSWGTATSPAARTFVGERRASSSDKRRGRLATWIDTALRLGSEFGR